jgi:sulfur carrier protein ThiS
LPPKSKGQALVRLDDGASLQDLLDKLGIRQKVVISLNNALELDRSRQLQDGDRVKIFSSISGG